MAIMGDADRFEVWADFMRQGETFDGLTKAQLRAAVDAADQWASDNALSFNSALPVAARTALTARQKSRLLAFVLLRRYNQGA